MANLVGKMLGSAGAEIVNAVGDQINRKAELKADIEKTQLNADTQVQLSQSEINKTEAASASLFVAGWRPFIGWICGVAMAYHFILQPFIAFLFSVFGHPIHLPPFDMNTLYTVLMGMLGLGTLRTVEKLKK